MRIRLTVPSRHVDEDTLGAALEASTVTAQKQVESGEVPLAEDAINRGLVKWTPEPDKQGFEGFDQPDDVIQRGWGDCDDLAAWHAASLRATGEDPDASAIVYQSGPSRWHAVVQRGDGSIDDPSRWAGMGKPGGPLPVTRPQRDSDASSIGFRKTLSGATRARIDVPLVGEGYGHGIGLALERGGRDPYEALHNASTKALALLGFWGAPLEVMVKLHAISHILSGMDEDEFADLTGYSFEDCGDFVCGLAERVGAATMSASVDPSSIANMAATFFDPLGLRNLIPGVAQSGMGGGLLSAFGGGGAPSIQASVQPSSASAPSATVTVSPSGTIHRTKHIKPTTTVTVTPTQQTTSGDIERCPPGWHWEDHGGVAICTPDEPNVSGADMPHHHHDQDDYEFATDEVRDDFDENRIPGYRFDPETGLKVPVVGAPPRSVKRVGARRVVTVGVTRSAGRSSSSGRSSGRSASSRSTGRSASSSRGSQQQSPYDSGYGGYDDGYGGYGPYYGDQPPQAYGYGGYDPSLAAQGYYGGSPSAAAMAASPYGQPMYGGASPYGYAAYSSQAWSPAQQGYAYDPASGMMMPYYGDDSGNPWDPNDPNSMYSRLRSQGVSTQQIQAMMAQQGVHGSSYLEALGQDLQEEMGE